MIYFSLCNQNIIFITGPNLTVSCAQESKNVLEYTTYEVNVVDIKLKFVLFRYKCVGVLMLPFLRNVHHHQQRYHGFDILKYFIHISYEDTKIGKCLCALNF